MQRLARRVMDRANLGQWGTGDGTFESRADMMVLPDSALVTALCSQLQNRQDPRDHAEAEYIALLLNISVGALPVEAPISRDIEGSIGRLVGSFEDALNKNRNLDTWQQIVEQVNLGNIDVPECPDAYQIFHHVAPCGD